MAFLQYKAGAIPGKPLKRKVTPEETREWKKQYENDRERKFVDSWKQDLFKKKNHYFIVGPVKSSSVL